jgi:Short C-terminal domain
MPGLLRGVARTAVVAGTATAVSGRVQRRQAERYADRDAEIMAQRQEAYRQQTYGYQQAPAPPPPPPPEDDPIERLKALADLRAQGILTEEEFAAQKAKILGA